MNGKTIWGVFFLVSGVLAVFLARSFFSKDDPSLFLPGATTHGHYQIELSCQSCHTPLAGVTREACLKCHEAELELADDSHPVSKFADPRNAKMLDIIDVRECTVCHVEHEPKITRAMGVTLPDDHCYHCHSDIEEERPSHQGMAFDGCAAAGCHNFHDNRALYEDFLKEHIADPDLAANPVLPDRGFPATARLSVKKAPLTAGDQDSPYSANDHEASIADWAATIHAEKGVNCQGCHAAEGVAASWSDKPDHRACATCHEQEVQGFVSGRHGMRLARDLSPMTPAMARLPMHEAAAEKAMTCNACHAAHRYDAAEAAVESCLGCHADEHSVSFKQSPHFALWEREQQGLGQKGSGVSCASCHLPRETHGQQGGDPARVQHNQNDNLRPNEKMIRNVCMNCHGVGFSIEALADPVLIQNNFKGKPSPSVETMDMIRKRLE